MSWFEGAGPSKPEGVWLTLIEYALTPNFVQ